jgi:hypothetical protein
MIVPPRCRNMTSLVDYPVALPTCKISPDTDATAVATAFAQNFGSLSPDLFTEGALWRDLFALTGTIRTFHSPQSISAAWDETSKVVLPGSFTLQQKSAMVIQIGEVSWLQAIFSFETAGCPQTECSAILALVPDSNGGWLIWCLRTILDQLKLHGNVDVLDSHCGNTDRSLNRSIINNSAGKNGHSGLTHFDCVIIGGGQAGLSAAGRLKALDVSYVVLDKQDEVGDSWKSRYSSAKRRLNPKKIYYLI